MTALGLDTSNYKTSAAGYDGQCGVNCGKLLDVAEGQLGLRQSDALFAHVKRLPEIIQSLKAAGNLDDIRAVAASTRPRAVEGSYMPCFLAGESQGRVLAGVLDVPFFAVSHQQGHLAAALWSARRMDLFHQPYLAWHLSGGTTELLLVRPGKGVPDAGKIGGTADLSAGQLIDRTGKLLGLRFPAGMALDDLACRAGGATPFMAKQEGLTMSLSGLQNKAAELYHKNVPKEEVAAFTVYSVCEAVLRVTKRAQTEYPGLPVLFTGGVSSNSMLRRMIPDGIFAAPEYSTDNAMGVAILGYSLGRCGQ